MFLKGPYGLVLLIWTKGNQCFAKCARHNTIFGRIGLAIIPLWVTGFLAMLIEILVYSYGVKHLGEKLKLTNSYEIAIDENIMRICIRERK